MTNASQQCLQCGESKPLNDFYRDKNKSTGYYSHCKSCHNRLSSQWKRRNKKRHNETNRLWREANPDKVRQSQIRNQGKRKHDPKRIASNRVRVSLWKKNHPDKAARQRARRRKKADVATQQRWVTCASPDNLCYWCGCELDKSNRNLDHVMPLSLGGPADPSNEVWACRNCNLRKHNKHPLVWLASLCSEDVA